MRVFMTLSTRYGECIDTYLVSTKIFRLISCENSFSIINTFQSMCEILSVWPKVNELISVNWFCEIILASFKLNLRSICLCSAVILSYSVMWCWVLSQLLACRTGVIFCVFKEQGRKRGEREARVACVGRFAKKSRLPAYHCSSSSAPRHTLNDQPITVLEKQW